MAISRISRCRSDRRKTTMPRLSPCHFQLDRVRTYAPPTAAGLRVDIYIPADAVSKIAGICATPLTIYNFIRFRPIGVKMDPKVAVAHVCTRSQTPRRQNTRNFACLRGAIVSLQQSWLSSHAGCEALGPRPPTSFPNVGMAGKGLILGLQIRGIDRRHIYVTST